MSRSSAKPHGRKPKASRKAWQPRRQLSRRRSLRNRRRPPCRAAIKSPSRARSRKRRRARASRWRSRHPVSRPILRLRRRGKASKRQSGMVELWHRIAARRNGRCSRDSNKSHPGSCPKPTGFLANFLGRRCRSVNSCRVRCRRRPLHSTRIGGEIVLVVRVLPLKRPPCSCARHQPHGYVNTVAWTRCLNAAIRRWCGRTRRPLPCLKSERRLTPVRGHFSVPIAPRFAGPRPEFCLSSVHQ